MGHLSISRMRRVAQQRVLELQPGGVVPMQRGSSVGVRAQ